MINRRAAALRLFYTVIEVDGVLDGYGQTQILALIKFAGIDSDHFAGVKGGVRSLLYVAITRARQLVFITGYGEKCGLIQMNDKEK